MVNTKTIGNKIAEARKRANISQAQLAERLFISPQAVGKWERGESLPDITTVNRLAEMLGVDLNYFSENFQSAAKEFEYVELSLLKQQTEMPINKQQQERSWDMSRGNWVDADFSGLKNLHEKLSGSNMQRSQFIGSDLSGLLLKSNHVDHCDFSGSDLSGSHIQHSHMANNVFKNCSLRETEIIETHMGACDFSGADFSGATIRSVAFEKNTLTDVLWNHTVFKATHLADIVFEGTLDNCQFDNCSFKKVTFQQATLINTFFKSENLKRIRFIDCQADRMTYAFLKNGKADLSGITLQL